MRNMGEKMKYGNRLGLATVAAAALMAFVGASTASATVLCKTPGIGEKTGTICPAGWAYSAGTELHMVSEGSIGVVITTGNEFTEVGCKKATIKGVTNNEGGATETVTAGLEAKNVTWSECSTPTGACTMTTVVGGTLEIHWIEGTHNGTVTANGVQYTTSCASIFGNIHCIYALETAHFGVITGGNPATLEIETAVTTVSTSGLCPETSKLHAKYEITTPKPLYVNGHT